MGTVITHSEVEFSRSYKSIFEVSMRAVEKDDYLDPRLVRFQNYIILNEQEYEHQVIYTVSDEKVDSNLAWIVMLRINIEERGDGIQIITLAKVVCRFADRIYLMEQALHLARSKRESVETGILENAYTT